MYAYVTVITKDFYLPFLIRQKQMMEYLNCKYPFLVLVSDTVSEKTLIELNKFKIQYKKIPTLSFKQKNEQYAHTINKFQCFNLIEYEKLIFFDADIIITKNFDIIFESVDFQEENLQLLEADNFSDVFFNEKKISTVFTGWFMFIKPSTNYFKKIIELTTKKDYNTDEQVINNCRLGKKFIDKFHIKENLYHFSGIEKFFNSENSNFLNKIFDYVNYPQDKFISFCFNQKNNINFYLHQKSLYEDYYMELSNYKDIQFEKNIFITFLNSISDIFLLLKTLERFFYLKSKYKIIIIITDNLKKELINNQYINNNEIFTKNEFKEFQLSYYEKIIYIPVGTIIKENIDNFFEIFDNYQSVTGNFLKFFNFKEKKYLILNNKLNWMLKLWEKNNILNFKIFKNFPSLKYYEFLNNLLFNSSFDNFNKTIDNYFIQFLKLNNSFIEFKTITNYLNQQI